MSLSQPLLSSNNIILLFFITAHQVQLFLIPPNMINKFLWCSETCRVKNIYLLCIKYQNWLLLPFRQI